MKKFQSILGIFLLMLILLFNSCAKEDLDPQNELLNIDQVSPTSAAYRASVDPVLYSPWQSGDAAFECNAAGGCGNWAHKVDNWHPGMDGTYSDPNAAPGTVAANTITITGSSDGYTFSWSSEYEVCAVIVKGSNKANVYYYPEGSCGDEGLVAPLNTNSAPADDTYSISHVTFCWNDTPCGGESTCYQDETAWAAGIRYVTRGNWATYTPYTENGQVATIYAGQTMEAGTVTFNDNGDGTIDLVITLNNSFIFYYDLSSQVADDNVKVQDYNSTPPKKNPAPGRFAWKEVAPFGSTSYTITVPLNNYYGIHLDVAYEIPCEE